MKEAVGLLGWIRRALGLRGGRLEGAPRERDLDAEALMDYSLSLGRLMSSRGNWSVDLYKAVYASKRALLERRRRRAVG